MASTEAYILAHSRGPWSRRPPKSHADTTASHPRPGPARPPLPSSVRSRSAAAIIGQEMSMSMILKLLPPSLRRKTPLYRGVVSDYLIRLNSGGGGGPKPPSQPKAGGVKPVDLPSIDEEKRDKEGDGGPSKKILPKVKRFPRIVRHDCWSKAALVPGRHPNRFRKDRYGNIVCSKHKVGYGLTYFQYDHIDPISGKGESNLDNCQILLSVLNNFKKHKNKTDEEMIGESFHIQYTEEELDWIELNAFGNIVRPEQDESDPICRCYTKKEIWNISNINWEKRTKACDEVTEKILVDYAKKHGLQSTPRMPGKDSSSKSTNE